MTVENNNNVAAALAAVLPLHGVKVLEVPGDHGRFPGVAVVPEGVTLESLKSYINEYLDRPERKDGTTVLTELPSFCRFVSEHKQDSTIILLNDSNPEAASLVAIIDAHSVKQDGANWQLFRARYDFPFSAEWKRWREISKKQPMAQKEFAELIEDVIQDVVEPNPPGTLAEEFARQVGTVLASPSQLLSMSRTLRIQVKATAEAKYDPASGAETVAYTVEHQDGKGEVLRPPGAFVIEIPVFRNGTPYRLPVRLRYTENGGKITWKLAMQRCEEVLEDALNGALAEVQTQTLLTPYRGIG